MTVNRDNPADSGGTQVMGRHVWRRAEWRRWQNFAYQFAGDARALNPFDHHHAVADWPMVTTFCFTIVSGSGIAFELANSGSVSTAFEGFSLPAALLAFTGKLPPGFLFLGLFLTLTINVVRQRRCLDDLLSFSCHEPEQHALNACAYLLRRGGGTD